MRAKQVIGSLATPGILERADGNVASIFPRRLRFQCAPILQGILARGCVNVEERPLQNALLPRKNHS